VELPLLAPWAKVVWPELLYNTVRENEISMCGVLPAVIVLETLRLLGRSSRTERTGYATTADVTGDTSQVVGLRGDAVRLSADPPAARPSPALTPASWCGWPARG
jgi:hypothetical protein